MQLRRSIYCMVEAWYTDWFYFYFLCIVRLYSQWSQYFCVTNCDCFYSPTTSVTFTIHKLQFPLSSTNSNCSYSPLMPIALLSSNSNYSCSSPIPITVILHQHHLLLLYANSNSSYSLITPIALTLQ